MTAATDPGPRIATLDILRGVAVMGILPINIISFAMPPEAVANPVAYGMESAADYAAWLLSFVVFEGKMRVLFSLLFGASMLLVIERAEAKGEPSGAVHFRRMAWLLVFGMLHYYLVWEGDILIGYALIGMVAWFFRDLPARALFFSGVVFVIVDLMMFASLAAGFFELSAAAAAPGADPETIRSWAALSRDFSVPPPERIAGHIALYGGDYAGIAGQRLGKDAADPFIALIVAGWETIGAMLLGMAGLKSGFLTGAWSPGAYRRIAAICLGIAIPAYAALAWGAWAEDFDVPPLFALHQAAAIPARLVMVFGIAALVLLVARPGVPLVDRIAAAGRAAFTNYLGTSIVMTSLFYGYGLALFGRIGRAEAWLFVLAAWALMLLWSKPWLDRYRYGPFEWLWRSLARWERQPMTKGPAGMSRQSV